MGAVAALLVWLAPLWLAILISSLLAVGFVIEWVVKDVKGSKETGQLAA